MVSSRDALEMLSSQRLPDAMVWLCVFQYRQRRLAKDADPYAIADVMVFHSRDVKTLKCIGHVDLSWPRHDTVVVLSGWKWSEMICNGLFELNRIKRG